MDSIDNTLIATVNIKEPETFEHAWNQMMFMGSSGGKITAEILINTFLQPDRDIESWIDGVQFTYNGESSFLGDHDPALCYYIYFRDGLRIEKDK